MRRQARPTGLDIVVRPPRLEASWWRRWRFEGQAEFREFLFNRYIPLARSIALRHFRRRVIKRAERHDFTNLAFEGLLQALDRFDPLRGVPFDAYARRRIAGCIADGAAGMSEVDAQLRHRRRVEQERLRSLRASNEEDAVAAMADLVGGLALGLMLEGTSLVESADGADTRPSAYDSLEMRELLALISREIDRLPEREAQVIRNHYVTGLTFAQTAALLGLSKGRISQLHHSALGRLRKQLGQFD